MFQHRPTGKAFNGVDINKLTIKFYGKRLRSTESLSIIVVFVENVPKHTTLQALIILSFDCVGSDQREMYKVILFAVNNGRISICSTKYSARLLYSKRVIVFGTCFLFFGYRPKREAEGRPKCRNHYQNIEIVYFVSWFHVRFVNIQNDTNGYLKKIIYPNL